MCKGKAVRGNRGIQFISDNDTSFMFLLTGCYQTQCLSVVLATAISGFPYNYFLVFLLCNPTQTVYERHVHITEAIVDKTK